MCDRRRQAASSRAPAQLFRLLTSWFLPSLVVFAPDREEAVEAGHLEGGHRRLRPDENEQLASSRLLMPAGGKKQRNCGRVDECDRPQIDGEVAHLLGRHLVGARELTVRYEATPAVVQLESDRLCQRLFHLGGAVEVELAGEY